MSLPSEFQMQVTEHPGFTHTVAKNDWGDYEVKWARGYPETLGTVPSKLFYADDVEGWLVKDGFWIVVNDKPKQNDELPNQFYFNHSTYHRETVYKASLEDGVYFITWRGQTHSKDFDIEDAEMFVKDGNWIICEAPDKPALTAEQQRTLQDFKERHAQLAQSIKLSEQDVYHKQRLIESYQSAQKNLESKIKDIEEGV